VAVLSTSTADASSDDRRHPREIDDVLRMFRWADLLSTVADVA
jgi:hypothetical protein